MKSESGSKIDKENTVDPRFLPWLRKQRVFLIDYVSAYVSGNGNVNVNEKFPNMTAVFSLKTKLRFQRFRET